MHLFSSIRALLVIVLVSMMSTSLLSTAHAEPLMYRPGQEYRSLNTGSYEIGIQKSGRVDVGLTSGEAVFINAFPMVWFADEKEPEEARLDGRFSNRFEVNDRLGRGQGMRIQYKQNLWALRTYPTKPFFAAQFTYTNTSKKPVTIKQLIPWAIGDPRKGSIALGDNTLDAIMLVDALSSKPAQRVTREGTSPNMMTVFNPHSGRSLLAGFVTQDRAFGTIELQAQDVDPEEPNQLDYMRAISTYDPPVTLQPGESLDSEILYLAITETEPLLAMERYAKGVAVTNQIPVYDEVPPRCIQIDRATGDATANAYSQKIMETAKAIHGTTDPVSDIQIILDPQWASLLGQPDPSLQGTVEALHTMGFQVGLSMNPFAFDKEALNSEHPGWGLPVAGLPESMVVLDITRPEARVWLEGALKNLKETYTFDALYGANASLYRGATGFASENALTKVEITRVAMESLRSVVGDTTPLIGQGADYLPTFPNTHFYESTPRAQYFFLSPHLGQRYAKRNAGDSASAFLQGITPMESLALFTESSNSVFTPALIRPAKPQDLFFSDAPSVWITRGLEATGNWILAGITNDSEATKTTTLPLSSPALETQPQYTLFDLQEQRYYGRTQDRININVATGKTRTLLLREVKTQPILVGSSYPISDTLPDKMKERWERTTGVLNGTITTRDTAGTLYVIVPKSLAFASASVNGQAVEGSLHDGLVHITVPAGTTSPINWSLSFKH